jgi:RNA polymerase sigma factor (sigma-70 family)
MHEMDRKHDELLAIRCQLGEPAAFDALIARWHGSLWKYLRRLTGDDDAAAEAVQEVWLRVLRGMPGLREASRLRAWLFGIARRVAMDRLRLKYSEPLLVSTDEVEIASAADTSDLDEDLALLHDELTRLPVAEREVLALFYLQELTLAEVAEICGLPVGTVKSRLFRARRLLRNQLMSKGVTR